MKKVLATLLAVLLLETVALGVMALWWFLWLR